MQTGTQLGDWAQLQAATKQASHEPPPPPLSFILPNPTPLTPWFPTKARFGHPELPNALDCVEAQFCVGTYTYTSGSDMCSWECSSGLTLSRTGAPWIEFEGATRGRDSAVPQH